MFPPLDSDTYPAAMIILKTTNCQYSLTEPLKTMAIEKTIVQMDNIRTL